MATTFLFEPTPSNREPLYSPCTVAAVALLESLLTPETPEEAHTTLVGAIEHLYDSDDYANPPAVRDEEYWRDLYWETRIDEARGK